MQAYTKVAQARAWSVVNGASVCSVVINMCKIGYYVQTGSDKKRCDITQGTNANVFAFSHEQGRRCLLRSLCNLKKSSNSRMYRYVIFHCLEYYGDSEIIFTG